MWVWRFALNARRKHCGYCPLEFRCIRSTPTEMQSMSENDLECFARTGVKSPANAMLESSASDRRRVHLRPDSLMTTWLSHKGVISCHKSLIINSIRLGKWNLKQLKQALKACLLCL